MYQVSSEINPHKQYEIGTTVYPPFGVFQQGPPAADYIEQLPQRRPYIPPRPVPYNVEDFFYPSYRHDTRTFTIPEGEGFQPLPRDVYKEPLEQAHLRRHQQQPFTTSLQHSQNEIIDGLHGNLQGLIGILEQLNRLSANGEKSPDIERQKGEVVGQIMQEQKIEDIEALEQQPELQERVTGLVSSALPENFKTIEDFFGNVRQLHQDNITKYQGVLYNYLQQKGRAEGLEDYNRQIKGVRILRGEPEIILTSSAIRYLIKHRHAVLDLNTLKIERVSRSPDPVEYNTEVDDEKTEEE